MGSSDNFCLRWNDFESNISTSFRELREDSEFLDVTLCCDNGVDVVQAHKVILAACSPLFRKILSRQKSQGQNPFLYLKGIRLKELRAVLDFIYHGEVNVAQDSLNNFLAVAEELAIKGLTTDSQKPGGGSGGGDPPNSEQRKKAVAKRKSVPQSSSAPVQIPVQAKKPKTDDDVEGIIEDVDVKGIKAEPEPSGSGVAAPNVPMVEAELDDSYGAGADDDNGDFGGGEEFEGFDQYGDGNDFDDSLGAAGASASAGADGKGGHPVVVMESGDMKTKMTLAQKVALIEESMQPDFDPVEARNRYNIKKSLYYNIVNRDKEKILKLWYTAEHMEGDRISMRLGEHAQMEEQLLEWLCIQNSLGIPVNHETLTAKANQILPNPSKNWMHNFRKRYKNVVYNRNTKSFHAFKTE